MPPVPVPISKDAPRLGAWPQVEKTQDLFAFPSARWQVEYRVWLGSAVLTPGLPATCVRTLPNCYAGRTHDRNRRLRDVRRPARKKSPWRGPSYSCIHQLATDACFDGIWNSTDRITNRRNAVCRRLQCHHPKAFDIAGQIQHRKHVQVGALVNRCQVFVAQSSKQLDMRGHACGARHSQDAFALGPRACFQCIRSVPSDDHQPHAWIPGSHRRKHVTHKRRQALARREPTHREQDRSVAKSVHRSHPRHIGVHGHVVIRAWRNHPYALTRHAARDGESCRMPAVGHDAAGVCN